VSDSISEQSERLCERAGAGDMQAASELVLLHYEGVFAFFRRWRLNDADARDLTQKTFAKVWASLPSYQGRSSFSTWVHKIGYNLYIDWTRKGNRLEARPDEWWETCVAEGPDPFENAAERELALRLHAMVAGMDENRRQAVHLHYYHGLSIKETAEVLDVATSTVKYRLRAALDELAAIKI
jgi:RNA polymerase sigma-70 factor (ECF subfamily)